MTSDAKIDQGQALEKARSVLSEHFEHGVILLTWNDGPNTLSKAVRWGNEHAQKSLIQEGSKIAGLEPDEEEIES